MNATSRHPSLPPVMNRMHSLSHHVRIRTRASLDRLAYANMLRLVTQEFYACESSVRKARAMLTQVVAEKVQLRSYLGLGAQNSLSAASQQYDVLHAYEQRLLAYLKQAGLELHTCFATLNGIKAEPYAGHVSQERRIAELRARLQATGAQQDEMALELAALLPPDQLEMPDNVSENPTRPNANYLRIVSRLRQWMPAH